MNHEEEKFKLINFRGKTHRYFIYHVGHPRFNEIDAYGVVWNGHYVNYFENARHALCRHYNFDMAVLAKLGFYLPVYKYQVSIRKPLRSDDFITVAVRLSSSQTNQSEFTHLLMSKNNIHAYGQVEHALTDHSGQIVLQPPDHIIKYLDQIAKGKNLDCSQLDFSEQIYKTETGRAL